MEFNDTLDGNDTSSPGQGRLFNDSMSPCPSPRRTSKLEDIGSDQTWLWLSTHAHNNPTTTTGQWNQDGDDNEDDDDHHH